MSERIIRQEKTKLHPRNKNRERYDLAALIVCVPELKRFVKPNKYGTDSIDFSDPFAVKLLNRAILFHYYKIESWDFPNENLCPPIPGRADYIHYVADLLSECNDEVIPMGDKITCYDIGIGASCIYPLIGVSEYGWKFIGSDIDQDSINSALSIVSANSVLHDRVECRFQSNPKFIFREIIERDEKFDISICNPPFHASVSEAQKGTRRKIRNLSGKKSSTLKQNFSGVSHEIIYEGGEIRFIQKMIRESERLWENCFWFTSLVSKVSNLDHIYRALEKVKAYQVRTIEMGTGNKSSRIVAWTFLSIKDQREWREERWT